MSSSNSGPGYARAPDHTVEVKPHEGRVIVDFEGEIIAESSNALMLYEADYSPVPYIPISDVKDGVLSGTDHSSHCPFKGDASYWTINAAGRREENAVWGYKAPYDEVSEITDHVAFYPNKVSIRME